MSNYWNERWSAAPSKYEGSWAGDPCMRMLELFLIRDHLRTLPIGMRHVVEIGCGPYTLDELPELDEMIDSYAGVDESRVAIAQAREEYVYDATKSFICGPADMNALSVLAAPQTQPAFLLSRRCLQNIGQAERCDLIQKARRFEHGIILECTEDGLRRCNRARELRDKGPIGQPEFNSYLTDCESELLMLGLTTPTFPMSTYYMHTRVIPDKRTPHGDLIAFRKQIREPCNMAGPIGPLTVWRW